MNQEQGHEHEHGHGHEQGQGQEHGHGHGQTSGPGFGGGFGQTAERLARLEALVEAQLREVLRRLDAINGSVQRTATRLDEHERTHAAHEQQLAYWQGEIQQQVTAQREWQRQTSEVARWRLALIVSVIVSTTNILIQLALRLVG